MINFPKLLSKSDRINLSCIHIGTSIGKTMLICCYSFYKIIKYVKNRKEHNFSSFCKRRLGGKIHRYFRTE